MAPSSHLFCRSFNLLRILGLPVGDFTWHQAKLPVSMGGLGLRTAENHAPAAYAASTLSSQLLVQDLVGVREPPLLAVAQPGGVANEPRPTLSAQLLAALSAAQGEEATAADLAGMTQKQMSVKIDLHQQQLLVQQVDQQGGDREQPGLPLSHCVTLVIGSTHLPSLL